MSANGNQKHKQCRILKKEIHAKRNEKISKTNFQQNIESAQSFQIKNINY